MQLAQQIIQELVEFDFHFSLVLADGLYGEGYPFLHLLNRLGLHWIVAIRSNHSFWIRGKEMINTPLTKAVKIIYKISHTT